MKIEWIGMQNSQQCFWKLEMCQSLKKKQIQLAIEFISFLLQKQKYGLMLPNFTCNF